MLEQKSVRAYGPNYAIVALAILLLLVVTPLAGATGNERVGSYSGDDAYDPAAGGRPVLSVSTASEPRAPSRALSYSGDDAYDPAAGSRPAILAIAASESSGLSYSGDDAYDAAAGGRPELSVLALAAEVASPAGCGLSEDEIAARHAIAMASGFSGDDAYDPAAGGTPELSLLPFADAPALATVCEPTAQ
jgi:hypothetical protein